MTLQALLLNRKARPIILLAFCLIAAWCVQIALSPLPAETDSGLRSSSDALASKNTAHYYTFIRIEKTGSTSFLMFMEYHSGLETLDGHVSVRYADTLSRRYRRALNCFYGTPHLKKKNKYKMGEKYPYNFCPHMTYNQLLDSWKEALPYFDFKSFTRDHALDTVSGVSTETFTLVREPFDRLRSLFYYMKKYSETSEWGAHRGTKQQYKLVRSGDFEGWMELVGTEEKHPNLQWEKLDNTSIDKAVAMVTGKSPIVTTFVNECFEASLRLLERKFSLGDGAVDSFLEGDGFVSRTNSDAYEHTPEADHLEKLRQRSKVLFPEEYKLYNAAVEQFQQQWALYHMDASVLQKPCELLE